MISLNEKEKMFLENNVKTLAKGFFKASKEATLQAEEKEKKYGDAPAFTVYYDSEKGDYKLDDGLDMEEFDRLLDMIEEVPNTVIINDLEMTDILQASGTKGEQHGIDAISQKITTDIYNRIEMENYNEYDREMSKQIAEVKGIPFIEVEEKGTKLPNIIKGDYGDAKEKILTNNTEKQLTR